MQYLNIKFVWPLETHRLVRIGIVLRYQESGMGKIKITGKHKKSRVKRNITFNVMIKKNSMFLPKSDFIVSVAGHSSGTSHYILLWTELEEVDWKKGQIRCCCWSTQQPKFLLRRRVEETFRWRGVEFSRNKIKKKIKNVIDIIIKQPINIFAT